MSKYSVMAITCDGDGCDAQWMGPSQELVVLDVPSRTEPVEWPEGWVEDDDGSHYCATCWLDEEEEEKQPHAASADFAGSDHKFYR